MRSIFLLVIIAVSLNLSFANDEMPKGPQPPGNEGHGGHGILIDKPYLVDLAEVNVHKKPYYDKKLLSHPTFPKVKERLKKILEDALEILKDEALDVLTVKLIEIHQINKFLGMNLLGAAGRLEWVPLDNELFKVKVPKPILGIDPKDLVMLGLRTNLVVNLNSAHVKQMDAPNQAALIVHEILYAMSSLKAVAEARSLDGKQQLVKLYKQQGDKPRIFTGFLFTPKMTNPILLAKKSEGYEEYFRPISPTIIALNDTLDQFRQYIWKPTYISSFLLPENATCSVFEDKEYEFSKEKELKNFSDFACPNVPDYNYKYCSLKVFDRRDYSIVSDSFEGIDRETYKFLNMVRNVNSSGHIKTRKECIDLANRTEEEALLGFKNLKSVFED